MSTTPTGAAIPRARSYTGAARHLPLGAVDRAARDLGCEPAALSAVLVVETGMRSGFLAAPDSRPRILYEAHIAHRLCGRQVAGLSVQAWDRTLYASTGGGEWDRLLRAVDLLGEDVALEAASWGVGQVLGMNADLCGFSSVQSFVRAMAEGEEQQLGAVAAFIKARGLADALRRKDWPAFARGYNGTAFAANAYDTKLAAAYARVISGTPADGALSIGDYGPEVASLQRALSALGYKVSTDGDFGRMTRNAVELAQVARGLKVDGMVGPMTAVAMGL
ncbi:N-acetylmuramidase domain-containing protein (plasmid) [Azospirillum sp. HJ39]|uniref:N-acetylmuramidase domain-containing protein n=1 Tax=Azospirillum sp. HJ39 TaxID=3159496 RepID=UPI0035566F9E